jgi:hypothetical protein
MSTATLPRPTLPVSTPTLPKPTLPMSTPTLPTPTLPSPPSPTLPTSTLPTSTPTLPTPPVSPVPAPPKSYVCEAPPQTVASVALLRGITTDPDAVSARFVLSPPHAGVGVNVPNSQGRVRVFTATARGLAPGTSYTVTVEFLDGAGRVLGAASGCGFETPIDVVPTLGDE